MLIKFAIQDLREDREFKNLSPLTIRTYLFTLNEFYDYCALNEVINVEDVTPSTIKNYILYCQKERHNNPTTRNSKLHHVKILFNYLQDNEVLQTNRTLAEKFPMLKKI